MHYHSALVRRTELDALVSPVNRREGWLRLHGYCTARLHRRVAGLSYPWHVARRGSGSALSPARGRSLYAGAAHGRALEGGQRRLSPPPAVMVHCGPDKGLFRPAAWPGSAFFEFFGFTFLLLHRSSSQAVVRDPFILGMPVPGWTSILGRRGGLFSTVRSDDSRFVAWYVCNNKRTRQRLLSLVLATVSSLDPCGATLRRWRGTLEVTASMVLVRRCTRWSWYGGAQDGVAALLVRWRCRGAARSSCCGGAHAGVVAVPKR